MLFQPVHPRSCAQLCRFQAEVFFEQLQNVGLFRGDFVEISPESRPWPARLDVDQKNTDVFARMAGCGSGEHNPLGIGFVARL